MTGVIAAIQHHRNHLRFSRRLVVIVLVIVAVLGLLSISALRHDASLIFRREVLDEVTGVTVAVVLIVVALAGMYSVMADFVFWEGWQQGLPDPSHLFETAEAIDAPHRHFVVYLDGIHQSEESHPPRVSDFLDVLQQGIAADMLLVKRIEAYTIMPVGLRASSYSQWFWQRLFALQEQHPIGLIRFLCAFFVQANNVIKVGISSDRRYGPVMNYELALKIARRLEGVGFHPSRASRVVLVGYSGGGEMAIGAAAMLQKICHVPVQVITVCGVFSGNGDLTSVDHVAMVVGSRDPVATLGRIAYPGRLFLLPLSNWNRWQRTRSLHRYSIDGMSHNGDSGPFSDHYRGQVVAAICRELELTTDR